MTKICACLMIAALLFCCLFAACTPKNDANEALKDMLKILGNREISVNRELTKKYQEVIRQDIETVLKIYEEKEVKGEFVLIVDGFKGKKQAKNNYDELSEREYVEVLINDGLSKKDAIKTVCKERKLKKDVVYKQVLDL